MKEFLKKFLGEEEVTKITDAYIKAHPDAKELPVYISKQRLDEVLGQKKVAEDKVTSITAQLEEYKKGEKDRSDAAIKAAVEAANAESNKTIETLKKDATITEAIYKAKGKNAVAIRALIDATKPIDDEIARLQKETPYLFGEDNPLGTGKHTNPNTTNQELEQKMRRAVGL